MSSRGLSQRKHSSGQWKLCVHCGAKFVRRANLSTPEWGRRRYCSKSCSARATIARPADRQDELAALGQDVRERGACRGSTANFVPDSKMEAADALRECRAADCPVRAACRAFAVGTHAYGVWGGEYFTYGEVKAA